MGPSLLISEQSSQRSQAGLPVEGIRGLCALEVELCASMDIKSILGPISEGSEEVRKTRP